MQLGYLRYCGSTQFANGIWAGIELDREFGRHDGSLCGKRYFTCNKNHGVFCGLDQVKKASFAHQENLAEDSFEGAKLVHGANDLTNKTLKPNENNQSTNCYEKNK